MRGFLGLIITVFLIVESSFFILSYKVFKLNTYLTGVLLLFTIFVYTFFIYQVTQLDRSVGVTHSFYWAIGFLLLNLVPKLIVLIFWLIGLLLISVFKGDASAEMMQGRKEFISKLGLAIAAIPFFGIIHGIWKGKYNFKVINRSLAFKDLPEAFNGFKILQISDLHSGSFDNAEKINYAVDLINKQDADLFLFTGDIVNTRAEEFHPWVETFNKLKDFPQGKYSVLGNHDYGEYVTWPNEEAKKANFEGIKGLHKKVNFELLLNENRVIEKDGSQLKLVGVENWGKSFRKAGDLNLASAGIEPDDFKILMSHDPSHWEYEVKDHPKNFQLTLSGHTHGLQFGIEIPGFIKWSPIQYVYKQWAGFYKHADKYINVNRGFGFHAFPGRVGIWPEITVIELRKEA